MITNAFLGFIDFVIGLWFGDEGKGKLIDYLLSIHNYLVVARFQGGNNAGHTLSWNGIEVVVHIIPSGVLHPDLKLFCGGGMVIDPRVLQKEINDLEKLGLKVKHRLYLAKQAHLITPAGCLLDAAKEHMKKVRTGSNVNTTKRGIGPAYEAKMARDGLRVGDILSGDFVAKARSLAEYQRKLLDFYCSEYDFTYDSGLLSKMETDWLKCTESMKQLNLVNGPWWLRGQLKKGDILVEGAQGSMLSIDYGTYPGVTSSNTTAPAALSALGLPPSRVRHVHGVVKALSSRVGAGPFPTEIGGKLSDEWCDDESHVREFELAMTNSDLAKLDPELAQSIQLRRALGEYGATTGRPRRLGWPDFPMLKAMIELNEVTHLTVNCLDYLDRQKTIKVCTGYQQKGKVITEFPYDLSEVEPCYEEHHGWEGTISECTDVAHGLPPACLSFTNLLENVAGSVGAELFAIGNGPGRDQLILYKPPLPPVNDSHKQDKAA